MKFIDEHRTLGGVELICCELSECGLQIAPSGYWAAKARPPSPRAARDALLLADIERIHAENYGVYGVRKVWHQLAREGVTVARCTVARLMRAAGLVGVVRGRGKVITTVANPDHERAPDLLGRDFSAATPNRVWVADFTEVPTATGTTVYIAFAVDIYSRAILGWCAATHKRTALVLAALNMALWHRDHTGRAVRPGLIHHSDAGSQYTSFRFTAHLLAEGIDASIGSVGDAYDNALMESTIGLYKTELINRRGPWHDLAHVEAATAEWIKWYNTKRLHSAIGHVPPSEYESMYYAQPPAS